MNSPASTAKAILRAEHRTLAAVINAMKTLAHDGRVGAQVDQNLWASMLHYIEAFPLRLHHPKEDACLFKRLRERAPEARKILDVLQAQHRAEPLALAEIRRCLRNQLVRAPGSKEELQRAVDDFAQACWHHMNTEEQELFALADAFLSDDDWRDVARVFLGHRDPLADIYGATALNDYFSWIASRAPAPLGLGVPVSSLT